MASRKKFVYVGETIVSFHKSVLFHQAKILDHDNVNYLKKILVELAMVLDQVEAELEKRKLEYQGLSFVF